MPKGKYSHMPSLDRIRRGLNLKEARRLSPRATLSTQGVRRAYEAQLEDGYRQTFSVDVDRILHSRAYTRYIDKTQVFYLIENDHITHRVLHVQLVSKIARTIGRFLGLNEDLIEAIALGHDIGHTPFGHDGENFLSELCRSHGIGLFLHNVQSVQFLDRVERKGKGWNLCLQTLDGILCHDGEIHNQRLAPQTDKAFEVHTREIAAKKANLQTPLIPMSFEGCVVRMADTISYVGRDLEDAIRLKLIKRSDIPSEITKLLGSTNGTIVYNLVTDIITHSFEKEYIAFSPEVSSVLKDFKEFNMEYIYFNPKIKRQLEIIRKLFEILFSRFLEDLHTNNRSSVIFTGFLEEMSNTYIETHSPQEIVRDFVSGMTDQYFLRLCPQDLRPKPML